MATLAWYNRNPDNGLYVSEYTSHSNSNGNFTLQPSYYFNGPHVDDDLEPNGDNHVYFHGSEDSPTRNSSNNNQGYYLRQLSNNSYSNRGYYEIEI